MPDDISVTLCRAGIAREFSVPEGSHVSWDTETDRVVVTHPPVILCAPDAISLFAGDRVESPTGVPTLTVTVDHLKPAAKPAKLTFELR